MKSDLRVKLWCVHVGSGSTDCDVNAVLHRLIAFKVSIHLTRHIYLRRAGSARERVGEQGLNRVAGTSRALVSCRNARVKTGSGLGISRCRVEKHGAKVHQQAGLTKELICDRNGQIYERASASNVDVTRAISMCLVM